MIKNIIKESLLKLPRHVKRGLVFCIDSVICLFTVWLAFGLRLDQWGYLQGSQWLVLVAAIGISIPLFIYFDFYRAIFRHVGSVALASMATVFIIYTLILFCLFVLLGVDGVPRSIGVIQPILLFIGIGVSRYFMRLWLGGFSHVKSMSHRGRTYALIYGAGSAGRQLLSALSSKEGILVKGFVDDNTGLQGSTVNGILVHSTVGLSELIKKLNITDVLLAIPSASNHRRSEIIASLNGCGVRVRTLPGIEDIVFGKVRVSDLHDLDMNDLLGRAVVPPIKELLEKNIQNQIILVTGAGGSIGSELCRQIIKFSPKELVLVDSSEHSLYLIYEELKRAVIGIENDHLKKLDNDPTYFSQPKYSSIKLIPCLSSVRDKDLMMKIFKIHRPYSVFHAAAYKHVPLVEENPAEGIWNNVYGTLVCAQVSLECDVSNFTLISTDKAVRPTNVMGATKRIAEMVLQALAEDVKKNSYKTNFSMVRFGNVLGSSGSVAPLFSSQIAAGGPITLTHPEVRRYFMTIPEAAQLVIQASAMANGGDVLVLDMGEPVRIYDLAVKMIYLSGLLVRDDQNPDGDIEIKVTGMRPGEKLYEELLIGNNPQSTVHPKIMKASEEFLSWCELLESIDKLEDALKEGNGLLIEALIKKLVPGYQPNGNTVNWSGGGVP